MQGALELMSEGEQIVYYLSQPHTYLHNQVTGSVNFDHPGSFLGYRPRHKVLSRLPVLRTAVNKNTGENLLHSTSRHFISSWNLSVKKNKNCKQ